MPGHTCAFRGCHSKTGGGVSLFSFPKDHDRAKLWLEACRRTDLLSKTTEELGNVYKLCEHHFEAKYYTAGASRKRLLPNAFPTLFPHAPTRTCDQKELQQAPPKKMLKNIIILLDDEVVPTFPNPAMVTDVHTIVSEKVPAEGTEEPLLDIHVGGTEIHGQL